MPLGKIGILTDCEVERPGRQLDREIHRCETKEGDLATENTLDYLNAWVVSDDCS